MNKTVPTLAVALLFCLFSVLPAIADLDNFLYELNKQASTDLAQFHSNLSNQFNLPMPQVDWLVKTVNRPADAFMCLQLSRMTGIHFEQVVKTYKGNRGKGWGVIAQQLGIKPGSPAFHALKQGNFVFPGIHQEKKKNKFNKNKGHSGGQGNAQGKGKKY